MISEWMKRGYSQRKVTSSDPGESPQTGVWLWARIFAVMVGCIGSVLWFEDAFVSEVCEELGVESRAGKFLVLFLSVVDR